MLDRRLHLHLVTWLGQWPAGPGLHVVGSARRTRPGADGRVRPAVAVSTSGSTVVSVPPDRVADVRASATRSIGELLPALPDVVGCPGWTARQSVFRWSAAPAVLPEVGEWADAADPRLPSWLRRLAQEVLVVRDVDGGYLAGAGVLRHDRHGHEVSVAVETAARGRGVGARLLAQAARRVLDEAAVPIYRHDPGGRASARAAESAGFADRGWWAYDVHPRPTGDAPPP